jgi:hypothetical protein
VIKKSGGRFSRFKLAIRQQRFSKSLCLCRLSQSPIRLRCIGDEALWNLYLASYLTLNSPDAWVFGVGSQLLRGDRLIDTWRPPLFFIPRAFSNRLCAR